MGSLPDSPSVRESGYARLVVREVAKLTQVQVVTSEIQRLICTGSLRMRSMRTLNCMRHKAILCGLVVCCGLLAKWLRISVMVRVRAGAREWIICTFFFCGYL